MHNGPVCETIQKEDFIPTQQDWNLKIRGHVVPVSIFDSIYIPSMVSICQWDIVVQCNMFYALFSVFSDNNTEVHLFSSVFFYLPWHIMQDYTDTLLDQFYAMSEPLAEEQFLPVGLLSKGYVVNLLLQYSVFFLDTFSVFRYEK